MYGITGCQYDMLSLFHLPKAQRDVLILGAKLFAHGGVSECRKRQRAKWPLHRLHEASISYAMLYLLVCWLKFSLH